MRRFMQFGLGVLVTLAVVGGPTLYAQLQQSGGPGSTVTVGTALPAGSNNIGSVNVAALPALAAGSAAIGSVTVTTLPAIPAGGNAIGSVSVTSLPALAAGANAIGSVSVSALPALAAGTNVVGVMIPKTPCGTTVANQALVAVPTSTGAVFAATTCIMRAYFNNTNATAQTVTLTDNSGTPLNGVGPTFSVPGYSNMIIPFDGIQFTSGVKWVAGGTGITGAVWGFQ